MYAHNCLVIDCNLELNSWTDAGEENCFKPEFHLQFTLYFPFLRLGLTKLLRLALNLLSLAQDSHEAGIVFPCYVSE